MYKIITLAAAASLLALTACDRAAETARAGDDAAANAVPTGGGAPGMEGSGDAPAPSSRTATSGASASGSETLAPAGSATAAATDTAIAPVTEETRTGAQMAAEQTNLHPKPPMN